METTDALGLQGTKTFEQVVVPQSADIKALPPVSFSFFDPEQKSYRTLTQPAVPLIVRPGGAAPTPTVAATTRAAPDNPPPTQDIVHIKPRLGTVAQIAPPLVQQSWFLALQAVPVLAWLSAVIWRRRADQLANNPRLRRRRQVAQIIRQGLLELRQHAADNKSDDFFATLFRLLQEQLGERLDLPASAITEAVIEEHLRPRGVPESALAALHELFQTCNLARYAPIKTSQELAAIIPKFEAVLRELQGLEAVRQQSHESTRNAAVQRRRSRRCPASVARFACWSPCFRCVHRPPFPPLPLNQPTSSTKKASSPTRRPLTRNSFSPGRFPPPLYFNLGNAWFKSGQIGRAIAAYRQAEQITPARPRFARQPPVRPQPDAQPDAVAHPLAALARPADAQRMDTAGCGRALALAAAAGDPAMAARPQAGAPGVCPFPGRARGALCACVAAALRETRFVRTAIVVTGEATVRYGPLAESPAAFTVHDGAELRVLDQKDEWLQVSAGPRRIGWLRRDQTLLPSSKTVPLK